MRKETKKYYHLGDGIIREVVTTSSISHKEKTNKTDHNNAKLLPNTKTK